MGGKKKAMPKVSREEFLLACKVVEDALSQGGSFSKNKDVALRTEAAHRTIRIYSQTKAAEVRAKRKAFRILEGGEET
jgi:hypothetical protein